MADFIKIARKDSLNKGRVKLNNAIDGSEQAVGNSAKAINTSNNAINLARKVSDKSDDTQRQLDDIILDDGTGNAEVIQARGDDDLLYKRLNKYDELSLGISGNTITLTYDGDGNLVKVVENDGDNDINQIDLSFDNGKLIEVEEEIYNKKVKSTLSYDGESLSGIQKEVL